MTALEAATLSVVELRRYTLKTGRRNEMIAIFERALIEPQEACGMLPIGHFRDVDDPQTFTWFRGFADMESRRRALEAFYLQSSVWPEHRNAVNETLIDSDNVLLLRPARSHSGFDLSGLQRAAESDAGVLRSRVAVAVFMLTEPASPPLLDAFERDTLPRLRSAADRIAYFVSGDRPNDFPRLPVREGEWAFVVCGVCADEDNARQWLEAVALSNLPEELRAVLKSREVLRLEPAARSLLH